MFRPLSFRRSNTRLPVLVLNRARNPCLRFRTLWLGLKVVRLAPRTCRVGKDGWDSGRRLDVGVSSFTGAGIRTGSVGLEGKLDSMESGLHSLSAPISGFHEVLSRTSAAAAAQISGSLPGWPVSTR